MISIYKCFLNGQWKHTRNTRPKLLHACKKISILIKFEKKEKLTIVSHRFFVSSRGKNALKIVKKDKTLEKKKCS